MIFGYDDRQTKELSKRLKRLNPEHIHPFLIIGIFFELERKRLEECIDQLLDNFALKPSEDDVLNLNMSASELTDYLKSCYRSQELQNQIGAFKKQLRKLHRETSRFERSISVRLRRTGPLSQQHAQPRPQVVSAGLKIKSRIEEMCDILDDKANECKGAIDNTSITMQTVS